MIMCVATEGRATNFITQVVSITTENAQHSTATRQSAAVGKRLTLHISWVPI